jgi:hypothetical protein
LSSNRGRRSAACAHASTGSRSRAHCRPSGTPARAACRIKRLRTHGLIKNVAHTYKCFFTRVGSRVVVTAPVIGEYFVQRSLVGAAL